MNVALVGPVYPHRGGIAHYTALLATHLSREHATRVYGFRRLYPDWLYPGRSQIDPSALPLAEVDARRWLIPWWPPSWRHVPRDWATWRPDVMVMQWWVPFMGPMTARLAAAARRKGIRTVMVCHNVLPHERSLLDRWLVKAALKHADTLIVHNAEDRARVQALLPGGEIRVTPHPTYAEFRSGQWTRAHARSALKVDGRVLLFFGIVRPYKGLLDLLDALSLVLREIDVTLLVVGEIWGDAGLYRNRVTALGLEPHVRFVDRYVPNEEVSMYFTAADLVVLPYRETTGSGVLQLVFGLSVPVIATRTGGMAEAVDDGETGFLVAPGDVLGLSQAIVRFFREDRAAEFRERMRRTHGRFNWEHLIETMLRTA